MEGKPILQLDYEAEYLLCRKFRQCRGGCRECHHTHLVVYPTGESSGGTICVGLAVGTTSSSDASRPMASIS